MLASGAIVQSSSDYIIDAWQTEDGLPQNSVNAIAQTPDGFLWLATFNGLVRFDGVEFKVFDPANTPALLSNRITRLYRDRAGRLWIISEFGNVTLLDQGQFHAVGPAQGLPPQIFELREDWNGNLWLAASWETPEIFRFRDGRFHKEQLPDHVSRIYGYWADRDGNTWFWDRATNVVRHDQNHSITVALPTGKSTGHPLMIGPRAGPGVLALATDALYPVRDQQVERCIPLPEPIRMNAGTFEDSRSNLWIHTWNQGLWHCDPAGNFNRFKFSESTGHAPVRPVFEDSEGNIWVGTDGLGLRRFKPRAVRSFTIADGLADNLTKAIVPGPQGTIWAINSMGVDQWTPDNSSRFTRQKFPIPLAWSGFAVNEDRIWVGTYAGGLFRFSGQPSVEASFALQGPDQRRGIYAVLQTRTGSLLVGGSQGVFELSENKFNPVVIPQVAGQPDVRALAEDAQGNIYVGFNGNGLFRRSTAGWERITAPQTNSLTHIYSLFADADGNVWVGNVGNGLAVLRSGQVAEFDSAAFGFPRTVTGMVEDNYGNLWLASNKGLFQVNRKALLATLAGSHPRPTVVAFGKTDGMESSECAAGTQPAICKAKDGKIWAATLKGVAMVDPQVLPRNERPPPVLIERVVMGRETIPVRPSDLRHLPADTTPPVARAAIQVPAEQERFEVHYAGVCLTAGEKVRYRYRLEGLESDWVEAGSSRAAAYAGISPGHYTFQVLAANNDGVWSPTGARLAIIKLPYYWQTSWFRLIALAALILGTGSVWRYVAVKKLQMRLARLEQQHALERERARIARDMHDDLGASLTQIGLLSELAQKEAGPPGAVKAQVTEIAAVAREAVQAMDEIVWAVNPLNDTLDNLANYLCQFAEGLFRKTTTRCRLDIPVDLPEYPVAAELRHNIFLTVKEALNNCAKHAQASEIWLRLAVEDRRVTLVVEDNGRGFNFPAPAGNTQDGLRNMAQRLRECGGEFACASTPGGGTRITMRIDLRPA